jgi:muramoyltetrapeptide carboxypeptidase
LPDVSAADAPIGARRLGDWTVILCRAFCAPDLAAFARCGSRLVVGHARAVSDEAVRGSVVQRGERVRLVSPSSPPDRQWLEESIQLLQSWGLQVDAGRHALDEHAYMAGRDADRLADLNDAFRDPSVRAIIATRGGAGSYRIVDGIDFDAVRADPKPVVGFSDITNIHLALLTHARLATIHGCLAGLTAIANVRDLLMTTSALTLHRNPGSLSAAINVPGVAVGPLVGGNLRELAGSVGTTSIDLNGSIVLIEDLRHVGIGQVDRNLTQLIRSGALDDIAAIAIGSFEGFNGYTDHGWTVVDVLHERLTGLGVPILGGLDLGHDIIGPTGGPDQNASTLGATATLDTITGTLTVGPCVQ